MSDEPQDNTEGTDAGAQREATRQARRRMLAKFIGVLAVLFAYTFLKGIEGAKRSYDEEHGRPIAIVADQYARENADRDANVEAEKAAGQLGSTGCPQLYTTDVSQTVMEASPKKETNTNQPKVETSRKNIQPDAILLRVCAIQGFFNESDITASALRETLEKKLMYQNFKDEKSIVDRLDDEILADAEFQKKAFLLTEEAESRARASKLPDLSQDSYAVDAALKENYYHPQLPVEASPPEKEKDFEDWVVKESTSRLKDKPPPSDEQIKAWRSKISQGRLSKKFSTEDEENLLLWRRAIIDQRNNQLRLEVVRTEIEKIDKNAQAQINAVYVKLKPKLGDLIKASPGALKQEDSVLAFFDPHSVLDEGSGTYVIYQTLRLTCVMVLVLGLVFVLILLLRPLPFFSSGTDLLMDHAGELFKRSEGAAPQLAKSLAVTVSALGVGAAVAVASGNAIVKKPSGAGDSGYVDTSGQGGNGQSSARGKTGRTGTSGTGDVVIEHVVRLSEPILYPSPITFSGPKSVALESGTLTPIETALLSLKTANGTPNLTGPELDQRITWVAKGVAADQIAAKLANVDLQELNKRTNKLYELDVPTKIAVLESWRTSFGSEVATDLGFLKKDVTSTKNAVEDLRDNSFERLQNSGGRNLLTQTKQVFNGNQYLTTSQSLNALRSLMRKLPNSCPPSADGAANGPMKKCCGATPTDAAYCFDPEGETILTKLANMVGGSPKSESDFMKELRTARGAKGDMVDKTIDRWKSVILKYTRAAY